MSNKKQSSVDWLFKQLWDEPQDKLTWYAILKQAKTMNTEEIDYKIQKAIEKFEEAKNKASTLRDMVYLDGVLSVLDTIKNETYGGNK
jgi:hypothetical protein